MTQNTRARWISPEDALCISTGPRPTTADYLASDRADLARIETEIAIGLSYGHPPTDKQIASANFFRTKIARVMPR